MLDRNSLGIDGTQLSDIDEAIAENSNGPIEKNGRGSLKKQGSEVYEHFDDDEVFKQGYSE